MEAYDPLNPPDPDEWQDLDEGERFILVEDHHRRHRVKLPNAQMHAVFHVIVENQIALGDEIPVGAEAERLVGERLDRHEAVHAVGSVLANHMQGLMGGDTAPGDNEQYYDELRSLKAAEWLEEYSTE